MMTMFSQTAKSELTAMATGPALNRISANLHCGGSQTLPVSMSSQLAVTPGNPEATNQADSLEFKSLCEFNRITSAPLLPSLYIPSCFSPHSSDFPPQFPACLLHFFSPPSPVFCYIFLLPSHCLSILHPPWHYCLVSCLYLSPVRLVTSMYTPITVSPCHCCVVPVVFLFSPPHPKQSVWCCGQGSIALSCWSC